MYIIADWLPILSRAVVDGITPIDHIVAQDGDWDMQSIGLFPIGGAETGPGSSGDRIHRSTRAQWMRNNAAFTGWVEYTKQ
jgi:hypothetical protein